MDEQIGLLREMRDLLRLIAEPAIAKRDEGLRAVVRDLVGRSKPKAKAVQLMDGTRQRALICQESGLKKGNLSVFEKSLRENGLIAAGEQLRLVISLPANFFEGADNNDR